MGKWEKLRLKSWAKRLKSVAISVFLMRLRHISYGIVLRCYSEKNSCYLLAFRVRFLIFAKNFVTKNFDDGKSL